MSYYLLFVQMVVWGQIIPLATERGYSQIPEEGI